MLKNRGWSWDQASAQNMWSARSTPCSGRGDLFIELIALISYRLPVVILISDLAFQSHVMEYVNQRESVVITELAY